MKSAKNFFVSVLWYFEFNIFKKYVKLVNCDVLLFTDHVQVVRDVILMLRYSSHDASPLS